MIAVSQFVSDVTDTRLLPKAVDNIYQGNVLTMRLIQNNRRDWRQGNQITFPVYLSKVTTLGSYSGFDTFITTQETKTQKAAFDPSQVYANISISGIQAAINQSGDAGVIDLITSELEITTRGLKEELATEFYGDGTGNSNKDFLGLVAAMDDTTSVTTYGGISRNTYTSWRGTRTAQSGSLSVANLASDFDAAQIGNDTPSLIVTTPAVFSIYEALLTPTVSHQFSMNDFRMTSEGMARVGGAIAANQGFRALSFRGVPVVSDEQCPSGNIFTLNENHLFVYTIPQPKREVKNGFYWTGWKEGINQDAVVGQLLMYGQFITDSPRTHARRTSVTS